ncbi:hypothetical protein [Tardiphaga sp.]|uniref:hypothetical protein n=1 Tax=Tardiphaga sp. TaxID=1926292 RepID=UPI00261DC9D9|nr:hypothetical protein [Tardiphaga sp.]MDB5621069.1 hypothetical protein [Tardiphaga sp.]
MLQSSTNPPQIVAQTKRSRSRIKSRESALSVISASIQPIETGTENDLLDTLCYMKDENDVHGMMGLYEFFAGSAGFSLAAEMSPRITGRAADQIRFENEQAWAKAYLVADFLKEIRPNRFDVERYSEILFSVTLQMGHNFEDAVAVVNEIATWDLKQPGVDS